MTWIRVWVGDDVAHAFDERNLREQQATIARLLDAQIIAGSLAGRLRDTAQVLGTVARSATSGTCGDCGGPLGLDGSVHYCPTDGRDHASIRDQEANRG